MEFYFWIAVAFMLGGIVALCVVGWTIGSIHRYEIDSYGECFNPTELDQAIGGGK